MRTGSLLATNFIWVLWHAAMFGIGVQLLYSRAQFISVVPAQISFEQAEQELAFAEVDEAVVQVGIRASESKQSPITVQLALPGGWFENESPSLTIAANESSASLELPLRKIPAPGQSEDLELQFGAIAGPGTARRGERHVVRVKNRRLPAAQLLVDSSSDPAQLAEPGGSTGSLATSLGVTLKVVPPRAARVELRTAGQASPGVDYRITGPHVVADGGRLLVFIPAEGRSTLKVETLHNAGSLNRDPKPFEISLVSDPNDPDLTVKASSIAGTISNSDRLRVRIVAEDSPKLYESNTGVEVVFKVEPLTAIPTPIALQVVPSGSPGLSAGDYALTWDPSPTLLGTEAARLIVTATNDTSPEQRELLTLQFPDGADFEIEGQREFTIPIHDDDRKLIARLKSTELIEGHQTSLSLAFDPADDAVSQVEVRLAQGDASRFSLVDERGQPVAQDTDSRGRPKFNLKAPGEYSIQATDDHDNHRIDSDELLAFEFVPAAIPQFQVPSSPLKLTLKDDDSMGNVLLVVATTKYVRERLVTDEPEGVIDPAFRQRFANLRQLPDGFQLVGNGVFFVGKSPRELVGPTRDEEPTYHLWNKGSREAIAQVAEFAKSHSLVDGNDEPACLVDCLHGVERLVRHYRKKCQAPPDLQVVVVWPSDELPKLEACVESAMPEKPLADRGQARFLWLGNEEGQLGAFFTSSEERISGFYDQFARTRGTLDEIPESSDLTLAAKLSEMLQTTPSPPQRAQPSRD